MIIVQNGSDKLWQDAAETQNDELEIDLLGIFLQVVEKWKLILKVALVLAVLGLLFGGAKGFLDARKAVLEPTYSATAKLYAVSTISYSEGSERSDLELNAYLLADCREVILNRRTREETMLKLLSLGYGYYEDEKGKITTIADLMEEGDEEAIAKAIKAYQEKDNRGKNEDQDEATAEDGYGVPKIDANVSVTTPGNTRLIYITVSDANETGLAMDAANTYADVAVELIPQLMPGMVATVFEYAEEPEDEADAPNYRAIPGRMIVSAVIFFVLGAFMACAYLAVRSLFDDRIRSGEEIEKYLDVPVAGVVPVMGGGDVQVSAKKHAKKERSKK